MSYPVSLLGGGTSPICHPAGPHQSHKCTKNITKVTTFYIDKEGNSTFKIACVNSSNLVLPCQPLGGYITHLSARGTPKSPKSTKNITKVTTFYLVATFIGKERNSLFQNCMYQFLCSHSTLSAS